MSTLKIIDFTGIPGSGKSTLSKEVYKNLSMKYKCINSETVKKIKGKKHSSKFIRYIRIIYLLVKNFKVTFRFLNFYKSIKPLKVENLRSSIIAIETFHDLLSTSKKFTEMDYLILDEGILHRLWSISLYGRISTQKQLKSLVQLISAKMDIINIYSYIERDIAVKRIKDRDTFKSRLDKMSHKELSKVLILNEFNQKTLHQVISSDKNIITVNLNGNESVREKLSKVTKDLIK